MATLTHLSSPERVKLFEIFLGIVSNQVAYCDLAVRITEKYGRQYHYQVVIANKFYFVMFIIYNSGEKSSLQWSTEGAVRR